MEDPAAAMERRMLTRDPDSDESSSSDDDDDASFQRVKGGLTPATDQQRPLSAPITHHQLWPEYKAMLQRESEKGQEEVVTIFSNSAAAQDPDAEDDDDDYFDLEPYNSDSEIFRKFEKPETQTAVPAPVTIDPTEQELHTLSSVLREQHEHQQHRQQQQMSACQSVSSPSHRSTPSPSHIPQSTSMLSLGEEHFMTPSTTSHNFSELIRTQNQPTSPTSDDQSSRHVTFRDQVSENYPAAESVCLPTTDPVSLASWTALYALGLLAPIPELVAPWTHTETTQSELPSVGNPSSVIIHEPRSITPPVADSPLAASLSVPPAISLRLRAQEPTFDNVPIGNLSIAAAQNQSSATPPLAPFSPISGINMVVTKAQEPTAAQTLAIPAIHLSLCGHMVTPTTQPQELETLFAAHTVSVESFQENPSIIFDRRLMFSIDGKVYPSRVAAPYFVSVMAYGQPLDQARLTSLLSEYEQYIAKKTKSSWFGFLRRSDPVQQTAAAASTKSSGVTQRHDSAQPQPTFLKSITPSSQQLAMLNLKDGANNIKFSVFSKLQRTQTVSATVYRWRHDTKIVISDIDGTITKSDALGHILPLLGKDWSHSGVAQLYSSIAANGYQFLYLTSRAVGQADATRGYLSNLKQGPAGLRLPPGPVVMSPDRLFASLHREVIVKKPQVFKIQCLTDIRNIFPSTSSPFYAGFGNRQTDAESYSTVGIPAARIFIVNPQSQVRLASGEFTTTYASLDDLANAVFPPLSDVTRELQEEYNDRNFWKVPDELEELEELPDLE
eukprot:TRINITY_DN12872_c0_g1_i1.p1 TRINITY_DN12872_c0_g1~~TRINITY_DN12872_c0_g1_i1.p1  ORF type:complete len:782 (-),score=143.09 TRINITY_DN12872_c0_g1_i1:16-2361(-)